MPTQDNRHQESISYEDAIKIAKKFAGEIADIFPERIRAVFVIGSLGSNYYRPGQSDIDTAIITRFTRSDMPEVQRRIDETANRYWKEYNVPKGFGSISFAGEQLYPPYVKEEELIQEILRLKSQSKLIYGDFDVQDIPTPDKEAIRNDILAFQEWSDSQPPFVHSRQSLTNSTLIALKRYLLLKYDIVEFNKFKVINLYLEHEPPMANDEIFDFITTLLHGQAVEWNEEIRIKYTAWHDELYRVVNRLVLYPKGG